MLNYLHIFIEANLPKSVYNLKSTLKIAYLLMGPSCCILVLIIQASSAEVVPLHSIGCWLPGKGSCSNPIQSCQLIAKRVRSKPPQLCASFHLSVCASFGPVREKKERRGRWQRLHRPSSKEDIKGK